LHSLIHHSLELIISSEGFSFTIAYGLGAKRRIFCLFQNASNNFPAGCWDYIAHPLLRLYLAKFSPLRMNEEEVNTETLET